MCSKEGSNSSWRTQVSHGLNQLFSPRRFPAPASPTALATAVLPQVRPWPLPRPGRAPVTALPLPKWARSVAGHCRAFSAQGPPALFCHHCCPQRPVVTPLKPFTGEKKRHSVDFFFFPPPSQEVCSATVKGGDTESGKHLWWDRNEGIQTPPPALACVFEAQGRFHKDPAPAGTRASHSPLLNTFPAQRTRLRGWDRERDRERGRGAAAPASLRFPPACPPPSLRFPPSRSRHMRALPAPAQSLAVR